MNVGKKLRSLELSNCHAKGILGIKGFYMGLLNKSFNVSANIYEG